MSSEFVHKNIGPSPDYPPSSEENTGFRVGDRVMKYDDPKTIYKVDQCHESSKKAILYVLINPEKPELPPLIVEQSEIAGRVPESIEAASEHKIDWNIEGEMHHEQIEGYRQEPNQPQGH